MKDLYQDSNLLEQLILICDVDGVIRESVEGLADSRVIEAIKALLQYKDIDVTFISGTPIDNDPTLESWRKGNLPLNAVFGSVFAKELSEGRITVYGTLGGHRMKEDGSIEIVNEFSLEASFELGKLLIRAFFKEVLSEGSLNQKEIIEHLEKELHVLKLEDFNQSTGVAAKEFEPIVSEIRQHLDPNFRLINNGAVIETQTSYPLWKTFLSSQWLKQELENYLHSWNKQLATGVSKRGNKEFNYLLVSTTDKGLTTKKHIEEKIKKLPRALIVTIGDTQVDFPMHENAHLTFHVGLEQVWKDHSLPQCVMVRNSLGEDRQHIEGTLKVLKLLKEKIENPFHKDIKN